jgi:hypothetical protein
VLELVHRFMATGIFDIDCRSPSDEALLGSTLRREHADVVEDVCLSLGPTLARLS